MQEPSSSEISLTIDLELQKYLEEIFKDKDGVAIVMDLRDGAIIAAGSFPEQRQDQRKLERILQRRDRAWRA